MSNGQKLIDRINAIQLDPELLMGAMEAVADMDPEDRKTFDGRTITIVRFVHEQDFSQNEGIDAAMSINFRLMALARLDLLAVPEWRITAGRDGDPDLLHENVMRCAATEPLLRDGEDVIFDRDRFEQRLAAMGKLSMESRLRRTFTRQLAK